MAVVDVKFHLIYHLTMSIKDTSNTERPRNRACIVGQLIVPRLHLLLTDMMNTVEDCFNAFDRALGLSHSL